jgi:hypothetical protein
VHFLFRKARLANTAIADEARAVIAKTTELLDRLARPDHLVALTMAALNGVLDGRVTSEQIRRDEMTGWPLNHNFLLL